MRGNYPYIRFGTSWELTGDAQYCLGQCRGMNRAISRMPLPPAYHEQLLQVSMRRGALATTAIEGNTLTDQEAELVARGESLPPSKAYQEIELRNVLQAMDELLNELVSRNEDALVSPELIKRFHRLIGQNLGEHLDADPGQWRTDERLVGTYRCPHPEDIPELVERLTAWLPIQFGYATGRQSFRDAVVQAIVTHVYVEWIHPFGDGNGRTGRLLEFYILLRAGVADIAAHILSNHYNNTRPEYYRQLDRASKNGGDLSDFIGYALQGLRDGLMTVLEHVNLSVFETTWRSQIFEQFAKEKRRKEVSKRRRLLALSMPPVGDFAVDEVAILTPEIARLYANLSVRTLQRDLTVLVGMKLVQRSGDKYASAAPSLVRRMPRQRLDGPISGPLLPPA